MGGSWRIGEIRGIEIGIHPSWLFVFFLVAWTLAVGLFPLQYGGLDGTTYWVMGFTASLLLFASVLVHELAHSFVALSRGLQVKSITLFIFGGVANIVQEAKSARDEFMVAVVGPLASLVVAGFFWAANQAVGPQSVALEGVLSYLAGINVILAVFNMIPGFPLDGGRVFRAVLWGTMNSLPKATRVASAVGTGIGYLFIFAGVYMAFSGALINGLWLAFIGWFLSSAAQATSRQTEIQARLRGVEVSSLMNRRPLTIDPNARLSSVVDEYILRHAVRALPVVEDGGELIGMVTLQEIRNLPKEEWTETPVRFAMVRAADLHTATPGTSLEEALRLMGEHDVNQLPVVEGDRLVGLLSRNNVIRFLQVREELGVAGPEGTSDKTRAA